MSDDPLLDENRSSGDLANALESIAPSVLFADGTMNLTIARRIREILDVLEERHADPKAKIYGAGQRKMDKHEVETGFMDGWCIRCSKTEEEGHKLGCERMDEIRSSLARQKEEDAKKTFLCWMSFPEGRTGSVKAVWHESEFAAAHRIFMDHKGSNSISEMIGIHIVEAQHVSTYQPNTTISRVELDPES